MTGDKKPTLNRTAPVIHVHDIADTMAWYQTRLGFTAEPFPRQPPYVFCVLWRDKIEIMLQKIDGAQPLDVYRNRPGGAWHIYLRMTGLEAMFASLDGKPDVPVIERPHRQPYGDTEFVIRDPNGYVLAFSEDLRK